MDHASRTFVLVHGAWSGGFIWRELIDVLDQAGHSATAPTLTGLGERRHLGSAQIDLAMHIEDVVAHILTEDLQNVVLVGWSYGGMVIAGVQARLPDRVAGMAYLDAFMPNDGESLIDYSRSDAVALWDACKNSDLALPSIPLSVFGLTDPALVTWLEPKLAPQPWRTFYDKVKASPVRPAIPHLYVACTGNGSTPFTARLEELEQISSIRVERLQTSHFLMLTAVRDTARVLVNM